MGLLYGQIYFQTSSVLDSSTRLTERQTDRRTGDNILHALHYAVTR